MSAPTNHWKLGVFVVLGCLLGAFAAVLLGARSLRSETVTYRSYFDEAVSGLDVGSGVSFRGVRIGNVSAVQVAPDRRHVEVVYELETKVLMRLGIARKDGRELVVRVPPDLRVQLSSTSITGGKYLKLDFFDPEKHPTSELPFEPGEHTIPTTPSTLKNLEDSLLRAISEMPNMIEDVRMVLSQVHSLLHDVNQQALPEKLVALMQRGDSVMLSLERAIQDAKLKDLSSQTQRTLGSLDETLRETRAMIAQASGETGLVTSLSRASDAVGDLAMRAKPAGGALEDTLRDLREMAVSVRRLTDALERDSDMLIKGRAKEKQP